MNWIHQTPEGVTIQVSVQPRSSKNQIVGLKGEALKIKLTAPPVEGAANKMLIELIAKELGVSKSNIEIRHGQSGKTKVIFIHSLTEELAKQRLGFS